LSADVAGLGAQLLGQVLHAPARVGQAGALQVEVVAQRGGRGLLTDAAEFWAVESSVIRVLA